MSKFHINFKCGGDCHINMVQISNGNEKASGTVIEFGIDTVHK